MDRVLKTLMALGAAGLIGIIIAIAVAQSTRKSTTHTAASRPTVMVSHPVVRAQPTTTAAQSMPSPTAQPVPSPTSGSAVGYASICQTQGKKCRQALLEMINAVRTSQTLATLHYDAAQTKGTGTCGGTDGHTKAMASTGNVWHVNAAHSDVSFPHNICATVTHRDEVVVSASGPTAWQALQKAEQKLMRTGRPSRTLLLSTNFTRAGVGVVRRGTRTFVTIDLLG